MKISCAMFSRSMLPRTLVVVAIGSVILPGLAFADSRIERVIQGSNEGSATVIIHNSSSVSTGGQTAAAGGSVITGNSSASSKVETHINSSSSGGSNVQVTVKTEKDGVVETKEYSDYAEPNEPVHVEVEARVDAEGSKVNVSGAGEVNPETKEGAENADEASTSSPEIDTEAEVAFEAESGVQKVFTAVPSFFKKLLSFFWPF